MDKVTIDRIKTLHPILIDEGIQIYNELIARNINVRFTQVLRTFQEQDELYAIGRTKPGNKVTNARGGQSYHNYGLAIDVCLLVKDHEYDLRYDTDKNGQSDFDEIVYVFKLHKWGWGGDFKSLKDVPHFEKTFNYTIPELLKMYNDDNFIRNSKYLNLVEKK